MIFEFFSHIREFWDFVKSPHPRVWEDNHEIITPIS